MQKILGKIPIEANKFEIEYTIEHTTVFPTEYQEKIILHKWPTEQQIFQSVSWHQ